MTLSPEVERRIEECRRVRAHDLDLSDCELVEIPSAVFELHHLRELRLGYNNLSWLPFALSSLYNLSYLDLAGNRFDTIPEAVCGLPDLIFLNFSDNQLLEVSEYIARLRKLRTLDLSYNHLSELPENLAYFHSLEDLILDNNEFKSLPEFIVCLSSLNNLSIEDNPLINPPVEIALEGIDAIRQYYADFQLGVDENEEFSNKDLTDYDDLKEDPFDTIKYKYYVELNEDEELRVNDAAGDILFEAKLLLVGEGRVGKTSLAKSLIDPNFVLQDEVSTPGIEVQSWVIPKQETGLSKDFRFNIWDFGGQAIYHQTHQFFLTRHSLYILVTESRRDNQNEDFYYWLNIIRLLGDNSPVILVLNKCDLPTKALPVHEYQAVFGNLVASYEISCKPDCKGTLIPLREAIRRIITDVQLMPHIASRLPGVYIYIREEISRLRDSGEDFISYDAYRTLCTRYGMNVTGIEVLSGYFHNIGVFLHFKDDPTLCETVILNHEWLTAGVYRVLDNQRVIDQRGRFSDADLIDIWRDEKYKHKRNELRSLMMNRKFELIYELPSGGYLAPQLLPVDEIAYEWRSDEANLRFEYRYKFMPKGILTRFIVKQHRDIYRETHWRYGVLLEWEDTRALVRERYFERKITIQLEGPNQRGFLDIIRKTIAEIHSSFNNLEVQEMIPCDCAECVGSTNPHFFDYAILRRFLLKRKPTVTCEKSVEDVDIRTLLSETVLPEREERGAHYHFGGDYIGGDKVGGDKVGNDKTQATIEDSENVVVGKRSRVRSGG